MNVDMPVYTVGHAHVRVADDRVWIWGKVGVAFTANAIEKLSEVTCVLILSFHDDPKNDVDERYIWSDVTISMSRSPFLCYSLSVSLYLSLSLRSCVCVRVCEGRGTGSLQLEAFSH